jgi:hypothetical protein
MATWAGFVAATSAKIGSAACLKKGAIWKVGIGGVYATN